MSRHTLPWGDAQVELELPGDVIGLDAAEPTAQPVSWPDLARSAVSALADVSRPCLVVPDRTRPLPLARALPAVLDALTARGVGKAPIPLLFASGTHAPMLADEIDAQLTACPTPVRERLLPLAHHCDASPMRSLADGTTRVHERAMDASGVLAIGPLTFHYLAGFGGGRKLLLPGIADRATATHIHATTISRTPKGRAPGAEAGALDDNPMHQAILARLSGLPPASGISVVLRGEELHDGTGGELVDHHRVLALRFARERTLTQPTRFAAAVVSAGGAPYDTDLVQAHKALHAVAPLLRDDARVVLLARMPRGLGHADFLSWVRPSADEQLERLLAGFAIGAQTAWSLRTLTDRFDVGVVSELDDDDVRTCGATPLALSDVPAFVGARGPIAVMPRGAARLYRVTERARA